MFLLRDKLITQSDKWEASTQNLQRNNVALQVEGFCVSNKVADVHTVFQPPYWRTEEGGANWAV